MSKESKQIALFFSRKLKKNQRKTNGNANVAPNAPKRPIRATQIYRVMLKTHILIGRKKCEATYLFLAFPKRQKTFLNDNLVADNEPLNKRIAKDLRIQMIGCASHRLNLAVKKFLKPHEPTLEKIQKFMVKLSSLKLSGLLQNWLQFNAM